MCNWCKVFFGRIVLQKVTVYESLRGLFYCSGCIPSAGGDGCLFPVVYHILSHKLINRLSPIDKLDRFTTASVRTGY